MLGETPQNDNEPGECKINKIRSVRCYLAPLYIPLKVLSSPCTLIKHLFLLLDFSSSKVGEAEKRDEQQEIILVYWRQIAAATHQDKTSPLKLFEAQSVRPMSSQRDL